MVATALACLVAAGSAWPVGATPRSTHSGPTVPGTRCPLFPADSFWNTRIDGLPVDARSAAWLARMHPGAKLHPDFGPTYGAQAVPYGIPLTVVHGAPRVPVTFMYADESDRVRYPLSRNTAIEGGWDAGGDRHAIVVDATTCTLFETWNTRLDAGGWTAGSGATWDLRSNRLRPKGWTSADAAGLPILPGLVRWDEVRAGHVDHAIRFTTDVTRRSFIWPARHQAGSTDDADAPPMGARFRLRPSFDTSGYSRSARVILVAMQRYGMVLADNGSPWFFQGTADPGWPAHVVEELKSIPAAAFEAVDTSGLLVTPGSAKARASTRGR
jgi:hypothetical protein